MLSEHVESSIGNSLKDLTSGFMNGTVLGRPVYPIVGFELTCALEETAGLSDETRQTNEKDLQLVIEGLQKTVGSLPPASTKEKDLKALWLANIPSMSIQDLICAKVYLQLAQPSLSYLGLSSFRPTQENIEDILEYRCSGLQHQVGYQDPIGSYEFRTRPALPLVALRGLLTLERILDQIAGNHGYSVSGHADHLNLSVNVRNHDGSFSPLHDLSTTEGREIARRTAHTMLDAMVDTRGLFMPGYYLSPSEIPSTFSFGAGHRRSDLLRVLPDRFEYRASIGPRGQRALALLAMMHGFKRGFLGDINSIEESKILPQAVFVASEKYDPLTDLKMLRIFQGHFNVEDGHLVCDPGDGMTEFGDALSRISERWKLAEHISEHELRNIISLIKVDQAGNLFVDIDVLKHIRLNYQSNLSKQMNDSITKNGGSLDEGVRQNLRNMYDLSIIYSDEYISELNKYLLRFKSLKTQVVKTSVIGFNFAQGIHGLSIEHAAGLNWPKLSPDVLNALSVHQREQISPDIDVLGMLQFKVIEYLNFSNDLAEKTLNEWHKIAEECFSYRLKANRERVVTDFKAFLIVMASRYNLPDNDQTKKGYSQEQRMLAANLLKRIKDLQSIIA